MVDLVMLGGARAIGAQGACLEAEAPQPVIVRHRVWRTTGGVDLVDSCQGRQRRPVECQRFGAGNQYPLEAEPDRLIEGSQRVRHQIEAAMQGATDACRAIR